MTNSPCLSVVVPTCDRPDTLRPCIETILNQTRGDIELVVSDNFSGPETRAVLDSFSDGRLVKVRTDRRLGMSAHWDFALNHARGRWVTVVGDDDGLLLDGVERFMAVAERADLDAISSQRCMYAWPGATGDGQGRLTIQWGRGFEVRDSHRWLARILRTGDTYAELPWIYTGGFVKRTVLDAMRARMGRCFASINPDMYSSVAVAAMLPRYGYSYEPFTIGGTSRHSNGLICFSTKREERKKIAFFSENELRFHPSLGDGFIPSLSLYLYESWLQCVPLHRVEVETDLAEQLALALALAKGESRRHVSEYCEEVALADGIDPRAIRRRSRRMKIWLGARTKVRRLAASVGLLPKPRKTVVRSPRLDTVMAAALEVRAISHTR